MTSELADGVVVAAQHGDTLAIHDVIEALEPYVGRICASIALSRGADATQETLTIVMRSLRSLREPAALFGWARTIAIREALRLAERDEPTPARSERLERLPAIGDPQLATDVRDVLARLSPRHRAILVLRDMYGYSEDEAAAALGVPAGTVKSRLHRARESFRKAWTS
jgi:RNA polymerase sigma factor (sigma-70 family)